MAFFEFHYEAEMYKIKKIHNSKEDFLPITAHIYNYSTDKISDDDGGYITVYDIKYVYSVNNMAYYFKLNDKYGLIETVSIYYNPSNPEEYSYYASYEQARKQFNADKFVGDLFFFIAIVLLLIMIFISVFTTKDIRQNRKVTYHGDMPEDKTYILDENGNWQLVDLVKLNKENQSSSN